MIDLDTVSKLWYNTVDVGTDPTESDPREYRMLKHICVMTSRVYDVGDTWKDAKDKARARLGEEPSQAEMRTAEVPDGCHLEFCNDYRGVSWEVVPDEQPTVATSATSG